MGAVTSAIHVSIDEAAINQIYDALIQRYTAPHSLLEGERAYILATEGLNQYRGMLKTSAWGDFETTLTARSKQ